MVIEIYFQFVLFPYQHFFFVGTYGFVLPADQILPNALEVLDGILALVDEARALGQL